ncbi:hypothetical protein LP417_29080 [Polaromonas sp. P1-6]|nr:hypothetical protein LP417_29080 [Polaromonas sp. P1-6]
MSDPAVLPVTELRARRARVRIAPTLGGRLTAAWLEGADGVTRPVLHPYPESAVELLPWAKGGLYPLIPYSGRIGQARLLHEGHSLPLAAHPGGEPHTLHGISQQRAWELTHATQDHATLRYRHQPDAHWPWHFEAGLDIMLQPQSLRIGVSLVNTDTHTMPGGIGLHPYVPYVNGGALQFEAGPPWPFDADCLAQPVPAATAAQRTVAVSPAQFDAGEVTLFHGQWAGEVNLRQGNGTHVRFTAQGNLNHLVIHRPAQAPYLCIEPVSHVADGFNLHARGVPGTGTRILAPGEALRGAIEITCAGDD